MIVPAGPVVVLRPPGPADRDALHAMYGRCGRDSRHARFLTLLPRLPDAHLDQVLRPADGVRAVVALDPRTRDVVALGSLHPAARDPDGRITAVEPALLVEDAWQRRGVGTLMLRHLLARARAVGPVAVTASVLASERHVVRMLRGATDGPFEAAYAGAVVEILAGLAPARPPAPPRGVPRCAATPAGHPAGSARSRTNTIRSRPGPS
jgi:GNAT superfamily N-acetyltransferase